MPCRALAVGLLVIAGTAACGQKGPPLPPLRPLPVSPSDMAARRVGDRVQLRFVVPSRSQDPAAPVSVARVDIYARSLGYGSEPPVATQVMDRNFLVGSVAVRPAPSPDAPPADPSLPRDTRPAPGDLATWSEVVPVEAGRPLTLTRAQQTAAAARHPVPLLMPPSSVAVPFTRIVLPARYYVAVAVSAQGRSGAPSAMLSVRLGGAPATPTDPALTFTETTLTLTWTSRVGSGAVIYESSPDGVEAVTPVQPTPIATGTWSRPVTFGRPQCYTIRHVQSDGPVSTEGAAAGPVCVTPQDTFPPSVPTDLRGASDAGRVILEWTAATAADLAGYHVLRSDGPDGVLRLLTQDLVTSTGYVDTTVRAGIEYVYAVVAVDTAGNRSEASAPARVTGRRP